MSSSENKYKLYYFNLRCRGELARLLMTYGGVPFEDIRVTSEQWPLLKEGMPMHQVPVLLVNGTMICQSTAIARYVARQIGIAGKTDLESAKADMLVEGVFDMWTYIKPTYNCIWDSDADGTKREWAKFKSEYLDGFLDLYGKFLKDNGGEWFVGNTLTWADIGIAEFLSVLQDCFHPQSLDGHNSLKDFVGRIENLPQLKDYVSRRQKTIF